MKRVRIGIIGAGAATEWAILPVLSGPDAQAPPDTGAWWGRRAQPSSDIRYQAPFRPEVVALCDADAAGAERVAAAARVRAVYSDWRLMLREVEMDALLCAAPSAVTAQVVAHLAGATGVGSAGVRHLWIDGPPSASAGQALELDELAARRGLRVWCAHAARLAAAHRAARRLVERDALGTVSALSLRWATPLHRGEPRAAPRAEEDAPHFASCYAALDLLLAFAAPPSAARNGLSRRSDEARENLNGATSGTLRGVANGVLGAVASSAVLSSAVAERVVAAECEGATSLWLRFAHGATATALFAGADSWSAPLPRLEVCGTQGRWLLCEAGRRLWLHQPRQAAHFWEPPGAAPHVSAPNVAGMAEDLKAFLALCAGERDALGASAAPNDDERAGQNSAAASHASHSLRDAARTLHLLQAAGAALHGDEADGVGVASFVPALSSQEEKEKTAARRDKSEAATLVEPAGTLPLPL